MQFGTSGALDRKGKHIPDASLGLDEAGSAGIGLQLAPQPQNVHIDATVEDILVRAGRLQQVFACEWALRRVEESDQQGIFTFRQRNHRAIGVGKPLNGPIEPPAAKLAAAVPWIPQPPILTELSFGDPWPALERPSCPNRRARSWSLCSSF